MLGGEFKLYTLLDWKHSEVCTISPQQKRSILYNYQTVKRINLIYDSFRYVDFALKNIVVSHVEMITDIKYANDFSSEVELNFVREQNYLLNSFLSAIFNYLDTAKAILPKLSKSIFKDFNDCRTSIYDTSILYKVGYNLRHYSQHYSFPITSAVNQTKWTAENMVPNIRVLTPIIDKQSLVKAKNFWKKPVERSALASLPDEIDAKEIIWEMSNSIERMHASMGASLFKRRKLALTKFPIQIMDRDTSKSPSNYYIKSGNNLKRASTLSLEVIRRLDGQPSCPKLMDFRASLLGLIPNVDLEKLGYIYGTCSIHTSYTP